jgi:hypothetical protein
MSSLVLFLKCVQFLKPCIQFLMDSILNLVIVQFLMKKKGDTHNVGMPPMSRKGRRVSRKGRRVLWGCVSLLLHMHKKDC